MRWLQKFVFHLQPFFRPGKIEAELSEELHTHLQLATEANLASGMAPDEARRAAQRELGGIEQIKEAWRDERGLPWLAHLQQDLRFGARMLWKHRGWSAFIALSLGLGIGVNVVVFSLVNALVFRPMPGIVDPARLIHLPMARTVTYGEYDYIRAQQQTLSSLAASAPLRAELELRIPGEARDSVDPSPRVGRVQLVSANYFSVLGATVALGRAFQPADEQLPGARPVVILNHFFWQARFNADPDIVGRTIFLNNVAFTVVGIARETPPLEPLMFFAPAAWVPLVMADALEPARDRPPADERGPGVGIFGRLKPGLTFAQARSDLTVLETRFAREFLPADSQRSSWAASLESGLTFLPRHLPHLREVVTGVLALSGMVLLVACANIASLLLARGASRQRELSVRLALGASRGRIVRQLLTESMMLACLGGILAVVCGAWAAQVLWPMVLRLNPSPEVLQMFGLDWRVAAYGFIAALATGLFFGLLPALETSRSNLHAGLKLESSAFARPVTHRRWRTILVGGQFAIAVTFLIPASLVVRMIAKNTAVDLPFDPAKISFFELSAPRGSDAARYPIDFERALLAEIRALPGVEAATVGDVWYGRALDPATLRIDGRSAPAPNGLNQSRVTPDFFAALGLSFRQGRNFTTEETSTGAPVFVVSESFAHRFWPDGNAVGRHVRIAASARQSIMTRRGARETNREVEGVVVGVAQEGVRAIRNRHEYKPLVGDLYSPLSPIDPVLSELWVRTKGDARELNRAVPEQARLLDREAVVRPRGPLSTILTQWRNETAIASAVAAILGGLTLVLAAMGIFGVMIHSVAQRTPEFGVRMALGADRPAIMRLVLGEGARLAGWGVALGGFGCAAISWWARSLLYGLSPFDPVTFAGISLLLGAVVLLAGWLPAHQATKVDPLLALRSE